MTLLWAAVIGVTILVALLGMLVVGLLRTHAEIIRRLDSLGVRLEEDEQGAVPVAMSRAGITARNAAAIAGVAPSGDPMVASPVIGTEPVLIAFLSTTCSSCTLFWEWIRGPYVTVEDRRYRVIVTTLGSDEESPTRALALKHPDAEVVMSSAAWAEYEVPGAPYFALVDPGEGRIIGEGTAPSIDALESFLRDSSGDREWDRRDRTDRDREAMVDEELRRAGLLPGDPRLYPEIDDGEAGGS